MKANDCIKIRLLCTIHNRAPSPVPHTTQESITCGDDNCDILPVSFP